jgi:hypothetical protein
MKKTISLFIFLCCLIAGSYAQEIRVKRKAFVLYPEYYVGNRYIGNSTAEVTRYIEAHSQDSLVIRQLYDSERLAKIYPKIYLYGACALGAGGLGLAYLFIRSTVSILGGPVNHNPDPNTATIARISLGAMGVGLAGILVSGGYFMSSHVKLQKAIKSYNNGLQSPISFEIQPFVDSNASAGLSLIVNF